MSVEFVEFLNAIFSYGKIIEKIQSEKDYLMEHNWYGQIGYDLIQERDACEEKAERLFNQLVEQKIKEAK